jgi:hypothetical protein
LSWDYSGNLNPPLQVTECKQSRGKDGPNLEDPRKAMIEQIHFQTQGIATNNDNRKIVICDAENVQFRSANVSNGTGQIGGQRRLVHSEADLH